MSLETLIAELESLPDLAAREKAREAISAVLSLHRQGLARMLELREQSASWAEDPLIGPLLVLHDLHPADFQARLEGAMARASATLRDSGADARLIAVTDGRVEVDYAPPSGSPATAAKLKTLLHDTLLEAVPDARAIEVVESARDLLAPKVLLRKESRA